MATSFSGGRSQSTGRKPPTLDKQLVNFYHLRVNRFCNLQEILLKVALNTKNQ
jgi:hypothetical protein